MKICLKSRITAIALVIVMLASAVGCSNNSSNTGDGATSGQNGISLESSDVTGKTLLASSSKSAETIAAPTTLSTMDTSFTARDKEVGYEQSTATVIVLEGTSAKISGTGATSADGNVTITAEGSYVISGTLDNGTIFVDADDAAKVQLVFDGASISCADFAAIFVKNANKVFITLNEGTVNNLADGTTYTLTQENSYVDGEQKNVDAVIYSRSDLSINGSGTLNVVGSYKHAIVSKDDLAITGGIINITAPNGGIYGNDSVKIGGGTITLTAGSDGIRAENNVETDRGFIYIDGGSISISAGSDGMQAATAIFIAGGTVLISAVKASLKCGAAAVVTGGTVAALGGKIECPISDSSTQSNILFTPGTAVGESASLLVAQKDSGSSIASFKVLRSGSVLFFTASGITEGTEYSLYQG
jgi:hypothetical protein